MTGPRPARKPRPPLDRGALDALALAHVARFATTRGKLVRYLDRKLRERGWEGEGASGEAIEQIAGRMVDLGYIDDLAYATARARSFTARGLGARRLRADLTAAGIAECERVQAGDALDAREAALRFAAKRKLGPFAMSVGDRALHQRQLASFLRAGHSLDLARRILNCPPGGEPDFS